MSQKDLIHQLRLRPRQYDYQREDVDGATWLDGANFEERSFRGHGTEGIPPQEYLQTCTGCRTLGELKRRLLPPNQLISAERSIMTFERRSGGPDGEHLIIVCTLNNSEGTRLGSFRRTLYPQQDLVRHDFIGLNEDHQRQGMASVLTQSAEEAWQAAGYKRIDLYANKDKGGYVWALQGFDFVEGTAEHACETLRGVFVSRLDDLQRQGSLTTGTYEMFRTLVYEARHPWQFAALTFDDKHVHSEMDGEATKLGKGLMMRKSCSWEGYKLLNDDWHGNLTANLTRRRYALVR